MIDFSPLHELRRVDFYFVRHGKSEGNIKDIVQGRQDHPLSEQGKEQAKITGQWFQGKPIVKVLTTPLLRGKETARILSETAGLSFPEELPSLIELHTGVFTGISLEEACLRYPEMYQQFLKLSWEGVEGAERIYELQKRAESVWNLLIHRIGELDKGNSPVKNPSHSGVLVVTHAGFLQWIVKVTLGSQSWFPLLPMGDCGIYHFSVEGTVTRWNLLNFQAPGVSGSR